MKILQNLNSQKIPKVIHYCWFGGKPLPKLAQKCIASWQRFCPDYEIKRWDESNYDIAQIPYTAQAYKAKKFAFVSDYARLDILHKFGGVYFDTDVEIIKDISQILNNGAFVGLEDSGRGVALNIGLGIAAPAHSQILAEILSTYDDELFILPNGSLNLKTIVERASVIFAKYGAQDSTQIQRVGEFTIYPEEYFSPISVRDGKLRITQNTYTIHHYAGSWIPAWRRVGRKAALAIGGEKLKDTLKLVMFGGGATALDDIQIYRIYEFGFCKSTPLAQTSPHFSNFADFERDFLSRSAA